MRKYNCNNKFINYAHRGASVYAPENTMIVFEKAIEIKIRRYFNEICIK